MSLVENKETYIGDGVYASWDGVNITLRAPSHKGNMYIYINQDNVVDLIKFISKIYKIEDHLK